MDWKEKAISILRNSLIHVPIELNELDWKSGLSPKTERLSHHISAFANLKGGGMFVFGVNNDGSLFSISKSIFLIIPLPFPPSPEMRVFGSRWGDVLRGWWFGCRRGGLDSVAT